MRPRRLLKTVLRQRNGVRLCTPYAIALLINPASGAFAMAVG